MNRKRVPDTTSGAQPYLDWHRTLGESLLMSDVDSVELAEDGRPLAFIELKPVSHVKVNCIPAYLASLTGVYVVPGKIGDLFRFLMVRIPDCAFLIVAPDIRGAEKWFHVFNFRKPEKGWRKYSEGQYVAALRALHERF